MCVCVCKSFFKKLEEVIKRILDLGSWRWLTSSSVLGMYALPTVLTVGLILKDAVLRDQCVVETVQTVCMMEPS